MTLEPLRIVPYDPSWPARFGAERASLLALFGEGAAEVHHIGSTSVPGLSAKPVLDILVEVPSLPWIDGLAASLESRGYDSRGEYGIPGRRYFSRPSGVGPKVHLHAFVRGDPHVARHLLFRDFLRCHARFAAQYGDLKTALALEHAHDRDAYQRAKADFIEGMLDKAGAWLAGRAP